MGGWVGQKWPKKSDIICGWPLSLHDPCRPEVEIEVGFDLPKVCKSPLKKFEVDLGVILNPGGRVQRKYRLRRYILVPSEKLSG